MSFVTFIMSGLSIALFAGALLNINRNYQTAKNCCWVYCLTVFLASGSHILGKVVF